MSIDDELYFEGVQNMLHKKYCTQQMFRGGKLSRLNTNYNLLENFHGRGLVPLAPVELYTDSALSNRSTAHLLMLQRAL